MWDWVTTGPAISVADPLKFFATTSFMTLASQREIRAPFITNYYGCGGHIQICSHCSYMENSTTTLVFKQDCNLVYLSMSWVPSVLTHLWGGIYRLTSIICIWEVSYSATSSDTGKLVIYIYITYNISFIL